jgi:hypothetical protein
VPSLGTVPAQSFCAEISFPLSHFVVGSRCYFFAPAAVLALTSGNEFKGPNEF